MNARSRSRWLRFSISSLLIAMTLAGIWLGWWRHRALAQKAARKAIQACGGRCYFDFEVANGKAITGTPSPLPAWLLNNLGIDYCHGVVEVDIFGDFGNVATTTAEKLSALPQLRSISVVEGNLRDRHLAQFARHSSLEMIVISPADQISDTGIKQLTKLPRLKSLYCYSGPDITDKSLRNLATMPSLQVLSLRYCDVSDQGLFFLRDMGQLKSLHVAGDAITDEGLQHLLGLTNLEELELISKQVTLGGIKQLQCLPQLRRLFLRGKSITKDDVFEIQKVLPNCTIFR